MAVKFGVLLHIMLEISNDGTVACGVDYCMSQPQARPQMLYCHTTVCVLQ